MRRYCLIILVFVLACTNGGKSTEKNAIDAGKEINEKSLIDLGGEEQYIEITGASDKNPVLLFIHGGPGWPQTPHLRYSMRILQSL